MEKRKLGNTDIQVSCICLGSMTWGQQNTQAEAFKQLDYAVAHGVNFIDTAEMYPVPTKQQTCGETERIIGHWLQARGQRQNVILATKITGPGDWLPHIRNGQTRFNRAHLAQALEGSLNRLRTDYVDLYQLHWPERETNFFGRLGYRHKEATPEPHITETLEALNELVQAGKIRQIGLSNETPWGLMRFLELARLHDWSQPISIQNPYSLLNRTFEIGLAEIAHREQTGLLAYSPLAFGVLTGKYQNGQQPAGARLTEFKQFSRYTNRHALTATEAYIEIANRYALNPAQMALAFVTQQPFVTSTIIGATTLDQLEANIASASLQLKPEVLKAIEEVHTTYPNPAP